MSAEELHGDAGALISSCNTALRHIEEIAEELSKLQEPVLLLGLLYELRDLKASTRKTFEKVEASLMPVMGEQKVTVEPYGEFTAHRVMKRTGWKHGEIIKRVVAQVGDEFYGQPPAVFAEEVAAAILSVVGLSAGKVTGLRARGLNPADFCDEDPGAWTLQLPRKVEDEDAGIFEDRPRTWQRASGDQNETTNETGAAA